MRMDKPAIDRVTERKKQGDENKKPIKDKMSSTVQCTVVEVNSFRYLGAIVKYGQGETEIRSKMTIAMHALDQ